jgi:hypothetical protein
MTFPASGRRAAAFETKGVANYTPQTSAAAKRNDGIEVAHAALAHALEASFPDAEICVLRDVADGLARRITGPELNLTDLTDEEEDALTSDAVWDALLQIAQASGGPGTNWATLSSELSSGGQALVDWLKQLGVEYLDVSVPADGDTIDFRDRCGDDPEKSGFRLQTLNVRPGAPGSTLEHIYVPDGTTVKGSWEGSTNVLLHFTDAQGAELRTTRIFQSQGGEWQQLTAIDLDSIEQSQLSHDAFIDAVQYVVPEAEPRMISGLYDRLLKRINGPVFDLSNCVGQEAQTVLDLPPDAWTAFLTNPLAAGVTTLIVSHELSIRSPLVAGLNQQLNPHDPRAAFVAAAQAALPEFPLGDLFDKLVSRIRDTVLELPDLPDDMAKAVRSLPQNAWNDFLRHPLAADLRSIVVSDDLFAGGPLVNGLTQYLYSSDWWLSPDPRTAFIAHAETVRLGYPASQLFDELKRRTRGKVLHLRNFENVEDLRLLPQEAWKAFLRHRKAAVLTTIKGSPELCFGGPLVPGLKMRLDVRDPRSAFVAAAQQALPGRPVYMLFDVLIRLIHGDKLDLSEAQSAVPDLRCLPRSAWAAFLRHPKAANLRSIIASDALFAGGPLVDTLQIELADHAIGSGKS